MKLHRLLISAVLPMMCLTVAAQESDNTPQKGDFTVAATVGYNSFTNVSALPGNLTDYEASAISNLWSDKKLMVGFEGGWFVGDKWKLRACLKTNVNKKRASVECSGIYTLRIV